MCPVSRAGSREPTREVWLQSLHCWGPLPQAQVHEAALPPALCQPPAVGRTHRTPLLLGGQAQSFPGRVYIPAPPLPLGSLGPTGPLPVGVRVRAEWVAVRELVGTLPRVHSRCSLNVSRGRGR